MSDPTTPAQMRVIANRGAMCGDAFVALMSAADQIEALRLENAELLKENEKMDRTIESLT